MPTFCWEPPRQLTVSIADRPTTASRPVAKGPHTNLLASSSQFPQFRVAASKQLAASRITSDRHGVGLRRISVRCRAELLSAGGHTVMVCRPQKTTSNWSPTSCGDCVESLFIP